MTPQSCTYVCYICIYICITCVYEKKNSVWFDEGVRLAGKRTGPRSRGPPLESCCVVTRHRLQAQGIGRKLPCEDRRKRPRGKLG